MIESVDGISVKVHVGRNLLHNAALFQTDKKVVWEYVSNGLQYVDPGTTPLVKVDLDHKARRISVRDNGRGMTWADLDDQFFVMHGENVDRKLGQPGRGRFGTGKSAAFGIAETLRITTVRGGQRSKVELSRADVEKIKSGDRIPVREIEREVLTAAANGTLVEIEGVHLRLDQAGVIRFIERHLAKWPRNATVFVNNHQCEYSEPPIDSERIFRPEGALREKLGDVELVVKTAKGPLEQDQRGVSIFGNGVWYETTLAGSEGRDMSQYVFGEIDVPALDEEQSPIPAFDISRSMALNPSNELVQAVYAFVGQSVETVRRDLVEREKHRKASEEAARLGRQAAEIAKVINEDFVAFRRRLAQARSLGAGGTDLDTSTRIPEEAGDDLMHGSDLPAEVVSTSGGVGSDGNRRGDGTGLPEVGPQVISGGQDAGLLGRSAAQVDGPPRPRGGFQVKFEPLGVREYRARYVQAERAIYVNLEHPEIAAAKGLGSNDDPVFQRLAYEVAFSEYAVALSSELAARDEYQDPTDYLVDIRDTLDRLARRAVVLYSE